MRDPCTTAPITSYDVQLDFDHDRSSFSICISNISSEITCILMSKYFPNHPITNVKYEVIVFAVNERGRGPISDMQGTYIGNLAITLALDSKQILFAFKLLSNY